MSHQRTIICYGILPSEDEINKDTLVKDRGFYSLFSKLKKKKNEKTKKSS